MISLLNAQYRCVKFYTSGPYHKVPGQNKMPLTF